MIDTHAHLYLCETPLSELVKTSQKAGITHIVNIGINIETSLKALDSHTQFPDIILPTIGVHPGEHQDYSQLNKLKELALIHPFVAIGEIGLDYMKMYAPKDQQIDLFIKQLEIAQELNFPIIIHNRHADDDIKAITDDFPDVPKLLHCFSSSAAFAEKMYSKNTFFSFAGNITYAKKGKTLNALRVLPLDHIFVETDSPYLTPKAHQGHPNQPAYVTHTFQKVCEIKEVHEKKAEEVMKENILKFFNFTKPLM